MTWNYVSKPTTESWTGVPKPTNASVISGSGDAEPWGVLIAITSVVGQGTVSVMSGWSEVPKPINSVWSFVSKPII